MSVLFRNFILLIFMLAASGLALSFRPTHRIADEGPKVNFEKIIPKQFGDWQEDAQQVAHIINPEQKILLNTLYSQTISRTYTNKNGEVIMLTIAYGADQSDSKALHYPEVCYPAQGFQVVSGKVGVLKTDFGDIRVKRLLTTLGSRSEPLTYWTTVANKVVVGGFEAKLAQMRYNFYGKIPDGLIFRVSSISVDSQHSYDVQAVFVRELMAILTPVDRAFLAGLPR